MGILMGALGGAGEAMAGYFDNRQKADLALTNAIAIDDNRSENDSKRESARMLLAEKIKGAPLDRLSAKAKQFAGEDLPVGPPPVVNTDPESEGYTNAMDQASDKAGILTRKRTPDEAIKMAVDDARVGDMGAYADYESKVGGPQRADRRLDTADEREANRSAASERRDITNLKIAEMKDAGARYAAYLRAETSEKNADKRLEAMVQKLGGGKDGTKEALSIVDGTRKELTVESSQLENTIKSELATTNFERERKAIAEKYQPQRDEISRKRKRLDDDYNSLRERVGLPGDSAAPNPQGNKAVGKFDDNKAMKSALPPSLPSGSKQIGTSRGKPVYQTPDGKQFTIQ